MMKRKSGILNHHGKRTRQENSDKRFPKQKRGGQVKVAEVKEKTGKVVVTQIVPANADSIILTSMKGQVVNSLLKSVPSLGRATSGVILMRFTDKSDTIAATCLESEEKK